MYNKLILSSILSISSFCLLIGQSSHAKISSKPKYSGFRILLTSIKIVESKKDEIRLSMNAINTGREEVQLGSFADIPENLELKFEESFHRSSLANKIDEIENLFFAKNILLPIGKILRNVEINVSSDEELFKSLSNNQQKYARHYQPRRDKSKPKLKYKTAKQEEKPFLSFNSKKKKETFAVTKKVEEPKSKKEKIASNEIKTKSEVSQKNNSPKSNQSSEIKEDMTSNKVTVKKEEQVIAQKPPSIQIEKEMEKPVTTKMKETKEEKEEIVAIVKKTNKSPSKKEVKETERKLQAMEDKKKKEDDDKDVLASLGVNEKKKETTKSKPAKKRSGSIFNSKEEEESFNMSGSIKASKDSYREKENCPDLVIDTIYILRKNSKWLEVEYELSNYGIGPANLNGKTGGDSDNLALRAFLSSTENLTRGSLPVGGGFVKGETKDAVLEPNSTLKGRLKLDIKKMTRFTPYLILSLDPFHSIIECDKTNNKTPRLIE